MPVHLSRKLPPRGSLLTQRVGAPNGLDGVVGGSTANASVLPGHPLRRKTRKRHNFIHKDLDGTGSCWRGVVEMVGIQQVVGTRSMSKKQRNRPRTPYPSFSVGIQWSVPCGVWRGTCHREFHPMEALFFFSLFPLYSSLSICFEEGSLT